MGPCKLNINFLIVTCTHLAAMNYAGQYWLPYYERQQLCEPHKGRRITGRAELSCAVLTGGSGRPSPVGCEAYGDTRPTFQGNTASCPTLDPTTLTRVKNERESKSWNCSQLLLKNILHYWASETH